MYVHVTFPHNKRYKVNIADGHCIAIPLHFGGPQPRAFSAPPAQAETLKGGDFVGSTTQGGSCNADILTLVPHGNGTHSECVGHIVNQPIPVHAAVDAALIGTTVISITPVSSHEVGDEGYAAPLHADDKLITEKSLKAAVDTFGHRGFNKALAIRTLPNDAEKKQTDYDTQNPPFFTNNAMQWIVDHGVEHLIVDFPSVDRMDDGGRLSNHRIFWQLDADQKDVNAHNPPPGTITEMAYIPDEVKEGSYMLSLQIPAFMTDAAPSRPMLYEVEPDD